MIGIVATSVRFSQVANTRGPRIAAVSAVESDMDSISRRGVFLGEPYEPL
jgi:hypothetical protein